MQESPIALCDRYQALQSTEDIDSSYLSNQHGSSLEKQLEGIYCDSFNMFQGQ